MYHPGARAAVLDGYLHHQEQQQQQGAPSQQHGGPPPQQQQQHLAHAQQQAGAGGPHASHPQQPQQQQQQQTHQAHQAYHPAHGHHPGMQQQQGMHPGMQFHSQHPMAQHHPQQQQHHQNGAGHAIEYGNLMDEPSNQLIFGNVARGLEGVHRATLQGYWQDTIRDMELRDHDFKTHALPLARIKKVMKTDEDVKMISAEAPILFAKACEIFITELTMRAWIHAEENKRRTLQRSDIANAISRSDMFDFLIDIVPREEFLTTRPTEGQPASEPVVVKQILEQRVQGAAGGFVGMQTGRPAQQSQVAAMAGQGPGQQGTSLWPQQEHPRQGSLRQGSLDKGGHHDPHAVNQGHHSGILPSMGFDQAGQQQHASHIHPALQQQQQQAAVNHGHPHTQHQSMPPQQQQQHMYAAPPPQQQQQQPQQQHYVGYGAYSGYYPADMASMAAAAGHYYGPPIVHGYDHQGQPITMPAQSNVNYGALPPPPPPPGQQQGAGGPGHMDTGDGRRPSHGYDPASASAAQQNFRPSAYLQHPQQARYGYEQHQQQQHQQQQHAQQQHQQQQHAQQQQQQAQQQQQQQQQMQQGAPSQAPAQLQQQHAQTQAQEPASHQGSLSGPSGNAADGAAAQEEAGPAPAKKPKAKRAPRGKKAQAAAAAAAAAAAQNGQDDQGASAS